jgi:hypothetical protein
MKQLPQREMKAAAVRQFEKYVQQFYAEVIGDRRRLSLADCSRLRFAAACEQITDQIELLLKQGVPVDLAEVDKLQAGKSKTLLWLYQKHRRAALLSEKER